MDQSKREKGEDTHVIIQESHAPPCHLLVCTEPLIKLVGGGGQHVHQKRRENKHTYLHGRHNNNNKTTRLNNNNSRMRRKRIKGASHNCVRPFRALFLLRTSWDRQAVGARLLVKSATPAIPMSKGIETNHGRTVSEENNENLASKNVW